MTSDAKESSPDSSQGSAQDNSKGDRANSEKRLPFEPGKTNKKKQERGKASKPAPRTEPKRGNSRLENSDSKGNLARQKTGSLGDRLSSQQRAPSLEETRIPDGVSRRMVRRMAVFSGVPSVLGMLTFVVSYVVITQGIYDLPNAAVVGTSLTFLILGGLGLSYGLLSASWIEDEVGSLLGVEQFPTNFSRMREAWKGARKASLEKRRAEADARSKGKPGAP